MSTVEKIKEGNATFYVIPLGKTVEGFPLYMDITRMVENGIRADLDAKRGYKREYGPNYGLEILKALEYVEYVRDKITGDDNYFTKFNTKNWSFFLGAVAERN